MARNIDEIMRLIEAGRLAEAADSSRRLIAENDDAEALFLLAVATGKRGLHGDALEHFRNAAARLPDRPDVAYNFGVFLKESGDLKGAVEQWSRAADLDPGHGDAAFNLARAYSEMGRWQEAARAYEPIVKLQPEHPQALFNLANAYFRLGRLKAARLNYCKLLTLQPGHVDGLINLGLTELRLGNAHASMDATRKAIALDGGNIRAHLNLGQALLRAGRLREGFAECEWRRQLQKLPFPAAGQAPWEGKDLNGKRILLYGEQGHGDAIHFLRYAPLLAERGASRVLVFCQRPLVRLAATMECIDQAAGYGDPAPDFDTYAPLMSLPHLLGMTGLDTIPRQPYLPPPRPRPLKGLQGVRRIGLVWAGNPEHDDDANRSCPLGALRPLLDVPGAAFFSLQVGEKAAEIGHLGLGGTIEDLNGIIGDYYDTAEIIQALSLVISVDTAVAHLAGAMDKPVWLLLPFVADWRWFEEGEDTPWYPSMRLFRQNNDRKWAPLIEEARRRLAGFIGPS